MIRIPKWNITEYCGYVPMTTFWQDFSIADAFGENAIISTYKKAFANWKHDYKYLTELVMVLNHKIHQYYGVKDKMAKIYYQLYQEANQYACNSLIGEELKYFYRTTD